MNLPTLATTTDLLKLMPGNIGMLDAIEFAHRRLGQALGAVGLGMNSIDTGAWRGRAQNAFDSCFFQQPKRWLQMADAHEDVANAVSRYADTLRWGHDETREAIVLWRRAQALTEAAERSNPALAFMNQLRVPHLAQSQQPAVLVASDPGAELRTQAEERLARARAAVANAGDDAARAVRDAAQVANPDRAPIADPQMGAGEGAGEFNTTPWWSHLDELTTEAATAALGLKWLADGNKNAAGLLANYLEGTGRDACVNADQLLKDVPALNTAAESLLQQRVAELVQHATQHGEYGVPLDIQSREWSTFTIESHMNEDWHNAFRGMSYSVSGSATVFPPTHLGEPPRVEVDYQVQVYDRYNFDRSDSSPFLGVDISHSLFADLHTAGLAQEFDTRGTSSTRHITQGG